MFKSSKEHAAAYAAQKILERELSKTNDLPPGFYLDLTGQSITITFPPGSVVTRDKGEKGDGIVPKKAVQNLYGYALWAFLIIRLKKFNQWNSLKGIVQEVLKEVVNRPTKNTKEEIVKEFPDVAAEIESLQSGLVIPDRDEPTPRVFKQPKLPATIVFVDPSK